jgi:cell wall-associated NlpC family hydrolase
MAYESVGGGETPMFNPDAELDTSRVSEAPKHRVTDQANTGLGPQARALTGPPEKPSGFSDEQLQNAKVIEQVGRELGASDRDIQIAIAAAIVESGLRNLNYGDRDSIGMFQQRDAWGSASARLDPYQSARMFFLGGGSGQRGLLDFTNRGSMSIGEAAQAVQVSAYPDRYAQHEAEAGSILSSLGGVVPTQPSAGTTLGSVPGIAEATQAPVGAPVQPTTVEVDGLGEITADETGIGALTFDTDGGPLDALEFGQAAVPQSQAPGGSQAPSGASQGGSGGSAPAAGTVTNHFSDLMLEAPAGPGQVFTGSIAGKDPYELTEWDGEHVDYMTAAALEAAKKEFGGEFSIMQGSHSTDVAASGSTHAGGGVVDLSVPDGNWEGAVTALRKIGFAAWIRNVDGYGQAGDGAHIHAILMGNERLSPQAQIQVNSYLNNDDGLAGSRADDGPRDYVNNRFSWGDATEAAQRQGNNAAVRRAMKLVGLPHKWGGKDYEGLDGEGLARMVFEQEGVKLPRHFIDSLSAVDPTPVKDMVEGDMIVWDAHPQWGTPHLGIYMGSGLYAEVRPGGQVQVSDLTDAPPGYLSIAPPQPIETGSGLNRPTRTPQTYAPVAPRSYDSDATPGGMTPTPAPAPVKPPVKPVKSSSVAPGGRVADGFV